MDFLVESDEICIEIREVNHVITKQLNRVTHKAMNRCFRVVKVEMYTEYYVNNKIIIKLDFNLL